MNPRRTVCALALPAIPLVLLAATLVSPTDSTENAVQLQAAAHHGAAWAAAAMLELLTAAAFPLAAAGVVMAVRGRGATLASVGGLMGALGTLGMASIALRHAFIYGLADIGQAQALHALDRVDHVFGLVVLPLMFLAPISLIVLAGAAARGGLAPRWVPVGAVVFFVVDMLPIPGAEIVQSLVGIATFAVVARGVQGESGTQRTRTATAAAARA